MKNYMENNSNKISIIVLTYNHERYIRQCLDSILIQKVDTPFEIVISDDASRDNTVAILLEYQTCHTNIQVLKADTNQGIIKNFKKCLDACDGYYYATCAGDDYWTDELKLQKQLDYLRTNHDCMLVHTDNSVIFENSGIFIQSRHSKRKQPIPTEDVFESLLVDNFIGAITIFSYLKIIKDACYNINLFDAGWLMEDYPLWLEIASNYKIGYINDITAMHRYNDNSLSNPNDRAKNYLLILSSYSIKFFFIKRYIQIINQDVIRRVYHNFGAFIFERSFKMNDRSILDNINNIKYTPSETKEWLYYLASKSSFISSILRIVIKLKISFK